MNDATELESSLTGAIDFFQNLRRKLGALESDAHARRDQMQTLSSALVTLEQDRKTDRQTLANLSGGLVKLQADDRLLEQQLNAAEARVASFQQDQQQMRQTLAAVADELRAQGADWLQTLETTLAQRLAPMDKIAALEQAVHANQERFEQFGGIVEAQRQRLQQFDIALEHLDQNRRAFNQTLDALKTDFDRHEQALAALNQTAGVDETARRGLQIQQERLDALTAASTVAEQNAQAAWQDIAQIKGELETQRRLPADVAQIRQEAQKHQDRLKHLETLMSKVAADTNSTRQILNVIQGDLTTQNDTLRELDQNWRDSLASYQERLSSVEIIMAGSGSAAPPEPAMAASADSRLPPSIASERLEALEIAFAAAGNQHQALEQELSVIQTTLERQNAHFTELQNALTAPLEAAQRRLDQLENALGDLRQSLAVQPDHEETAVLDSLRQALAEQSAALEETQQLAWAQIQDLQQRLSDAEAALDSASSPTPAASAETDAALDSLRQALAEQSAALEETQQLAWAQIQDLQQRLSDAEATLDSASSPTSVPANPEIDAALETLRQALAEQSAALEETQQLAWAQIQDLQQRLSDAEAALDSASSPAPEPGAGANIDAALDSLREDLSAQVGTLAHLREGLSTQARTLEEFQSTAEQRWTALSAAGDAQQQDLHDTVQEIANLQQNVRQLQQQPAPEPSLDPQRLDAAEQAVQELRQELETLQESVTALETRLSSQSQAFSGHFEQFRNVHADLHALQQQLARLDASPRQMGVLEQELASHEQELNQLKEVIEQIQTDAQQMSDSLQPHNDSPIAEVAARLDQQQERWSELTATVETLRADSKAAQETVVTMATNVAKRIHEIQNLLVATENTQSERLQEVEQKLIHLQAAFETLENQRKPRKWFSMPASLTSIMLTVGAGGLAVLAQVLWTIG